MPLITASMKSGMSKDTAHKYSRSGQMPSENRPEHTWRKRIDLFEKIWNTEIKLLLELNNLFIGWSGQKKLSWKPGHVK